MHTETAKCESNTILPWKDHYKPEYCAHRCGPPPPQFACRWAGLCEPCASEGYSERRLYRLERLYRSEASGYNCHRPSMGCSNVLRRHGFPFLATRFFCAGEWRLMVVSQTSGPLGNRHAVAGSPSDYAVLAGPLRVCSPSIAIFCRPSTWAIIRNPF